MITKDFTLEIQTLLLKAMITDLETFTRVQHIIKPEYFDDELKGTVKFILQFAEEFNSIPSIEQIEATNSTKLEKLTEFNEQHKKYYLEQIEAFCRHKALIQAIMTSVDHIQKGNTGTVEQLVKDALLISLETDLGLDYFEDPRGRLLSLKEENGNLSTGFLSLDRKLYNVGRGETLLFLGISGAGKSVVMQNMTLNLALQGLNVVFITLELSEKLCAKRLDSMSAEIATTEIYKKLDEVELKVKQLSKRTGNITIKKFQANITSTRDVKAYLKEYEIQKGHRPDVLVVDYLDLMSPNDKKINVGDFFVKDKFISEELRNLAVEYSMLLVTCSQLNRSAIDTTEYDQSHIAGGKSKIDVADNVIAIRTGQTSRDRGEMILELIKTRNSGGVGSKLSLNYDLETLRLTDAENEDSNIRPVGTSSVLDQIKNSRNNLAMQNAQQKAATSTTAPTTPPKVDIMYPRTDNTLMDFINKNKHKFGIYEEILDAASVFGNDEVQTTFYKLITEHEEFDNIVESIKQENKPQPKADAVSHTSSLRDLINKTKKK